MHTHTQNIHRHTQTKPIKTHTEFINTQKVKSRDHDIEAKESKVGRGVCVCACARSGGGERGCAQIKQYEGKKRFRNTVEFVLCSAWGLSLVWFVSLVKFPCKWSQSHF